MSAFDDEMSAPSSDCNDQQSMLEDTTNSGGAERTNSSSDGGGILGGLLGRKASAAVNRSKCLVYLVLALAAIGFGLAVFFLLKQEETDDFETQFGDFSQEILSSAESNARDFLGQLKGVSNTLTSYSLDTEAQWPNVTLPHFDIRTTESFERLAGAEVFVFAPIVTKANLPGYERYAWDHQGWIRKDLELRGLGKLDPGFIPTRVYPSTGELEAHLNAQVHVPIWQLAPVPTNAKIINLDLYSHPSFKRMIDECTEVRHILLSEVVDRTFISENIETLDSNTEMDRHPRSYAVQPVFRNFGATSDLVGFVFAVVPWWTYLVDVLPAGAEGYVVEIQDTCGSPFFYRLDGPEATYLEDFRPNPDFAHMAPSGEFAEFARFTGEETSENILHCSYRMIVHPSDQLKREYETKEPIIYTVVVIAVFVVTVMVFILYDYFVQQRQDKVMRTAQKTSAIVSSLFPKTVQTRIMQEMQDSSHRSRSSRRFSGKDMLKNFLRNDLDEEPDENGFFATKPIADFFPETTIMFGDLVGFTAWSSTREPQAVFTLLETIYHEFDQVANLRRVFKVETIGDCYVAVAGLPDPRSDHALCMARFAHECLTRLTLLTKRLEVELGPDTGDLGMRIGIHSGPVTAGVLRGERARFQLFGDTMNTASRMESTGSKGMIQMSQETAELLMKAGKEHWVTAREKKVEAKGKGCLQTYYLKSSVGIDAGSAMSKSSGSVGTGCNDDGFSGVEEELRPGVCSFVSKSGQRMTTAPEELSDKVLRLVEWNVDILMHMLQEIEAQRLSTGVAPDHRDQVARLEYHYMRKTDLVITEVQEIITLPEYTQESLPCDPSFIMIDKHIQRQLHQYILGIASMYHANPFHNFEHASHVTMSVVKLFSRIIAPDKDKVWEDNEKSLHDHTYGITSDPLTQFAVIVSGLIHDVDHVGVPNSQMAKEQMEVAKFYKNKSVAEQNSVDLAWALLMKEEFLDLRHAIYKTEAELKRFRELVVNAVLATDIMDKDLKALRNSRWDKAFTREFREENVHIHTNRRATIVIEHLMQASDVSHTMQHWHIYRKWNEKLFEEMYIAYQEGRADKDPSDFWYKGEIGFFDFYIIPLAKKLKECGVFGVSSDEYLQYATNNRNEWLHKGEKVVQEIVEKLRHKKQDLIAAPTSVAGCSSRGAKKSYCERIPGKIETIVEC